jgi:hypothetical protein
MVTNTSVIIGGEDGVRITGGIGTVINSGTIIATVDDGIGFFGGGTVSNAAGATIAGQGTKGAAIYITGGIGTVTNSGSITAIDYGVDLALGGTVANAAGGNISSHRGVYIKGASGVVTNSGSIAGTTSYGVKLAVGGQVSNGAGGSISGPLGVTISGAAGTVTNDGTISGTSHAVTFAGGGANRLVAGPTGVFIGDVVGSTAAGSTNTLELAGGTGTISGLTGGAGSVTANARTWSFKNFTTIAEDAGGVWTLNGKNTVATLLNSGTLNIASGASLTVTAAIDPSSTGVFNLNSNAILEIAANVGSGDRIAFLNPAKAIIDKASLFGTNVGKSTYTGPLIEDFGAGDSIDLKDIASAGVTLSYAGSTGLLQIASGGTGVASLLFQNSSLGLGVFRSADDGSGHALITLA